MKKFDMNLSDSYVESWGTWEALRELVSNAMDADDNYKLERVDDNNILISTTTVPKISELRVIGCSGSRKDDKKIGKFGEGFKLAALSLTRNGDVLKLITPKYEVSFVLEMDDFGETRTLQMLVDEKDFEVIGSNFFIQASNVGNMLSGKFFDSKKDSLIEKEYGYLNIYYKGIWVSEIKENSLYDYSLGSFDLNRDRNVVNEWSFAYDAASFISSKMSLEIANKIINNHESYEMNLIRRFPNNFNSMAKKTLSDAVAMKYGDDFLVSTDDSESNQMASARGQKVVRLPDGLNNVCDIKTTKQFLSSTIGFSEVLNRDYKKEMLEVEKFLDLFSINCDVRIFENNQETMSILGQADEEKNTIWLNEKLFLPGRKKNRISTMIHEIAHLISKSGDGTIGFEETLSNLLGELGVRFLEFLELGNADKLLGGDDDKNK